MRQLRPNILLLLLIPDLLLAGGLFCPQTGSLDPGSAPECAVLCWHDGREQLVLQPSFRGGEGTNFAWILPLPAVPSVEPVSSGLIPTVRHIFQPHRVLQIRPWWPALLFGTGIILGIALIARTSRSCARTLSVLALGLLTAWIVISNRASGMATNTASLPPAPYPGLDAALQIVEITTLEAPDPSQVLAWLDLNGFSPPTNATDIIASYVRKSWIFVAIKAQRTSSEQGPGSLPTLCFTFDTPRPVYPLALTASDEAPDALDLFIFGPGRATAGGFRTVRCSQPSYPEPQQQEEPRWQGGPLQIRHPDLRRLSSPLPVATWLHVQNPAEKRPEDVQLRWYEFEALGERCYTRRAAAVLAANVMASALLGCALILASLIARRLSSAGLTATGLRLATTAIGLGMLTFWMTPKIDGRDLVLRRISLGELQSASGRIQGALQQYLEQEARGTPASPLTPRQTEDILRAYFRNGLEQAVETSVLTNVFCGQRVRLEDSPGNYTLEPAAAGLLLLWHDADGAAIALNPRPLAW